MNSLSLRDLDRRAVFLVAGALFVPWAALVIGLAWLGQAGAVCLTPVGWLLAIVAGRGTLAYTRSQPPATRRAEAGVAGALLGGLQGMLFIVMLQFRDGITSPERFSLALLGVAVTFGGLMAGTIVAFATAAVVERGRAAG